MSKATTPPKEEEEEETSCWICRKELGVPQLVKQSPTKWMSDLTRCDKCMKWACGVHGLVVAVGDGGHHKWLCKGCYNGMLEAQREQPGEEEAEAGGPPAPPSEAAGLSTDGMKKPPGISFARRRATFT